MNHLQLNLDKLNASDETLGIVLLINVPILAIVNGILYYRWIHSKTIEGVIQHIEQGDHYDKRTLLGTPDYYAFKARIPSYDQFAKLQKYISESIPIIKKLTDGQNVSTRIIDYQIDKLGIKIEKSAMDNYNGHFKAFITSILANGVTALTAGALFYCILGPESAFIGGVSQFVNFGRFHKSLYEYFNSDRALTARELGWNQDTFKQACYNFEHHYNVLARLFGDAMINKMKGGEIQLPSKVEANHTRLFADLLLRQIKAEAIVLGTIFAMREF